jgi:chromosomal replication initiator protein
MTPSSNAMTTEETASPIKTQWMKISGALRDEIGEAAYQSWLKPISVGEIREGLLTMSVPTRFMRDWVLAHYADRLRALWGGENPDIRRIDIVVQSDRVHAAPAPLLRAVGSSRVESTFGGETMDEIGAPLDPRYTFENFVVGKPNEFAYAAARRVAAAERVPFNPLFLYGGVGLGKTHLLHAIGWDIRCQIPVRSVIYLSAEKFMYRFIRALREQNTVDFKEQFRSVDVLMIDDVQFISGKDSTQEEFFHTFNALVDQGRQIVLSADKSPSDLEGIQDRLRRGSAAAWSPTSTPPPTSCASASCSPRRSRSASIPGKVMEFLAHKITSNVRELEGALNRVVAHAQLVGRDITLETTQEVLQDLLRAHDRRVTIEEIQKQVAAHFNIRISDMGSARRARSVARPRQVAMYLAKQLTSRSLPEIGPRSAAATTPR